jgi:acyl-coenzyme A thioesterase PaaI-like protein
MPTLLERVRAMIRGEEPLPAAARLIGFQCVEVDHGHAVFEMEAGPQHANPMGTLHGGGSDL